MTEKYDILPADKREALEAKLAQSLRETFCNTRLTQGQIEMYRQLNHDNNERAKKALADHLSSNPEAAREVAEAQDRVRRIRESGDQP